MELLYHYIWMHKIHTGELRLCDGRPVSIKSPGLHNLASGPDFSHARVRVEQTDWIGNVEIHVKASDWFRHGHQNDPAYDNVILHVVAVDDARVRRSDGSEIPQLVLPANPDLFEVYAKLSARMDDVRCLDRLPLLSSLTVTDWLESLAIERLQMKAARIKEVYRQFQSDWAQALFVTLARAMGFGLNGIPFEMLAKSIPLKYIFRHGDNPMQIEALMFGQAGLLDPTAHIFDDYYQLLCREYLFLARKYGLKPLQAGLWKTTTRPANSPQRRIAILSAALTTGFTLFDSLLECKGNTERLTKLFRWEAGEYWKGHTVFGSEGRLPARLADSSISSLMINLAAPFYTAYASLCGEPEWAERSVDLLMSLPGEENSKTRQWRRGGIGYPDALRSQALIQLKSEYCDRGRCLDCRFGHALLRNAAVPRAATAMEPAETYREKPERIAVVAMDSWKGCMDAALATDAAAEGLRSAGWATIELPMADGGEGTAQILAAAAGAKPRKARVSDPLGRATDAIYYYDENSRTAYMDFAAASGLTLLKEEERDPMEASSYGTGELILAAKRSGATRVLLGLGGSATVDGGLGALAALGAKIFTSDGIPIERPAGKDLERIGGIEPVDPGVELILLTDVDSPLTGERGAARVFGPQKGADEADVERLEAGMLRLAAMISSDSATPGYGAAGGAGCGLSEFAGGKLCEGARYVAEATGLKEALRNASLAVTGEGKADRQTLMGKAPAAVMQAARECGVPAVIAAGKVSDREALIAGGFAGVIDINEVYTPHPDIDVTDRATARARLRAAMSRIKPSP